MLHMLPFSGNTPRFMLTQLLAESYVFLSGCNRMEVSITVSKLLPIIEIFYLCLTVTCTCTYRNPLNFSG